jgi:hypothetical protein
LVIGAINELVGISMVVIILIQHFGSELIPGTFGIATVANKIPR